MLIARNAENEIWAHAESERAKRYFEAAGAPQGVHSLLIGMPLDMFISMFPDDFEYKISLTPEKLN